MATTLLELGSIYWVTGEDRDQRVADLEEKMGFPQSKAFTYSDQMAEQPQSTETTLYPEPVSQVLRGDINNDNKVDFDDFFILADDWGKAINEEGQIVENSALGIPPSMG